MYYAIVLVFGNSDYGFVPCLLFVLRRGKFIFFLFLPTHLQLYTDISPPLTSLYFGGQIIHSCPYGFFHKLFNSEFFFFAKYVATVPVNLLYNKNFNTPLTEVNDRNLQTLQFTNELHRGAG